MKLVSMKLSKKEAKEETGTIGPASADKLPRYPYQLEIRLDTDLLEKLGLDIDDYSLGDKIKIEAEGEVTDKGEHQRLGGEERTNMSFQITDLGIAPSKQAKKEKAQSKHLDSISRPTRDPSSETD